MLDKVQNREIAEMKRAAQNGEVKPQSATTPVTVSGKSVPLAISTAVAPMEMPSSTIFTSPPARSVSSFAQSRMSKRSWMP